MITFDTESSLFQYNLEIPTSRNFAVNEIENEADVNYEMCEYKQSLAN